MNVRDRMLRWEHVVKALAITLLCALAFWQVPLRWDPFYADILAAVWVLAWYQERDLRRVLREHRDGEVVIRRNWRGR